jgi:hypothetical protein
MSVTLVPFRDHLELQLIGEVLSRASQGQSHAQIEEWVKSVVDPASSRDR